MNAPVLQLTPSDRGITFQVRIQPRASRNEITGLHDSALKVRLKAPPVEGAANKMCLKFLSKILDVSKSNLEIASGTASRRKRVLYHCPAGPLQERELKRLRRILAAYQNI